MVLLHGRRTLCVRHGGHVSRHMLSAVSLSEITIDPLLVVRRLLNARVLWVIERQGGDIHGRSWLG